MPINPDPYSHPIISCLFSLDITGLPFPVCQVMLINIVRSIKISYLLPTTYSICNTFISKTCLCLW